MRRRLVNLDTWEPPTSPPDEPTGCHYCEFAFWMFEDTLSWWIDDEGVYEAFGNPWCSQCWDTNYDREWSAEDTFYAIRALSPAVKPNLGGTP